MPVSPTNRQIAAMTIAAMTNSIAAMTTVPTSYLHLCTVLYITSHTCNHLSESAVNVCGHVCMYKDMYVRWLCRYEYMNNVICYYVIH